MSDHDEINALITAIYSHPEGGAGGPLHIVLDDGNTRDADLRFCLNPDNLSNFDENMQSLAKACGDALLAIADEDERGDVIDRYWKNYRDQRNREMMR